MDETKCLLNPNSVYEHYVLLAMAYFNELESMR